MIQIYSTETMRSLDETLAAQGSLATIIDRAGFALAQFSALILGGAYGKVVVIVVGKGNNGADGRACAKYLSILGASVGVIEYEDLHERSTPRCDLLIDAVFGFGFHGDLKRSIKTPRGALILSVDMPSGVNSTSGEVAPGTLKSDFCLVLAGLKRGLLSGDAIEVMGESYLCDLGVATNLAGEGTFYQSFDFSEVPTPTQHHKWKSSVAVFSGSQGMEGAAILSSVAAMRAGAGIVHLFSPSSSISYLLAASNPEVVLRPLLHDGELQIPKEDLSRFNAIAIGPGLGRFSGQLLEYVGRASGASLVVDADAISALAASPDSLGLLKKGKRGIVLTPHMGELDRLSIAFGFAKTDLGILEFCRRWGVYMLVKGFPTFIYSPEGHFGVVSSNGSELATAGSGDVLSGIIAGVLANEVISISAIAKAAYIHGLAGRLTFRRGMISYDLLDKIPRARWLCQTSSELQRQQSQFVPLFSRGPLISSRESKIDWGVLAWGQNIGPSGQR
ncbi:NAD(P)H-hydrate dehydratase [Acidithrix ferrooxidans]|uniref:ADP-dependent (S)-NAD(P)H-hydrate dehydratase n=2 Tax=root TaxID=1 RepID=A0A0D8HKP3_9ACTN|nr:NAD(P)H-hydrate dehydratase [Acidithrix ferrooxidans]KJF18550.1 bifunctional NAD(P)H-hydrate repair enzyme Nnr [Acidithrix ferrooxidans]